MNLLSLVCRTISLLMLVSGQASATGQTPISATNIRPAMLRWQIGIERPEPANDVIETISAINVAGRPAWRVTHYPADPTEGTFDFYDVDRSTFAPIRSLMRSRTFELALTFEAHRVLWRRTAGTDTRHEEIALVGAVMPEGPGDTLFVAALPLKPGYALKYQLVDRFGGSGQSRVKDVALSVSGRLSARFGGRSEDVLEVRQVAADGSFTRRALVRAETPHYPFRVEYTRGKTVFASEVSTMAIETPNK